MGRMAQTDALLETIEAIHAAGLDTKLWDRALAGVTRVVGGIAATLEVFERKPPALTEFHSFGLPPANELAYLDQYAALNPRIPALVNGRPGEVVTDYAVMSERAMNRDAFYADFLAPVGYRYFVGGILAVGDRKASLFSVQRALRQGHVGEREIALVRCLAPHLRQAHDTAARLEEAERRTDVLERALDWLAEGAALLASDGRLLYANEAFDVIVRRADAVRIVRGAVAFAAPEAHARLGSALAAIRRLRAGDPRAIEHADFPVPRPDMPAYMASLRPLVGADAARQPPDVVAILFVRDSVARNPAAARMLRALFELTAAEANLALAIQAGVSLPDYTRQTGVSLNTIYTHLRRIKEKTGCRRIAGLNRLLRELQVPLRSE